MIKNFRENVLLKWDSPKNDVEHKMFQEKKERSKCNLF